MTAPEKNGLKETLYFETDVPGVTVRGISEADLPEVKALFEDNVIHSGPVTSDEFLYDRVAQDVARGDGVTDRRLGVRFEDKLVGYIDVSSSEISYDPSDVEISYFIDKKHIKKGIAKAAVGAVVGYEDNRGHNVIAEVDYGNEASLKLLKKLGFEEHPEDKDDRIVLARRALVTKDQMERFGLM